MTTTAQNAGNTTTKSPASAPKPDTTAADAKAAANKARDEKRAADEKAKTDAKALADKAKAEKKAADEKAAADKRAADEKAKADAVLAAAKAAEEAKAKRDAQFAALPRIKLADTENVVDTTGLETSPARKYEKVHAEAVAGKLPIQRGWKHSAAVFVPGHNKGGENGFKPGSVYGTIADIVTRAGRSGITAQELVTLVRMRQIGNKRSVYCTQLPPVGWAEGWVNTAVTKNIAGVHATKRAPALVEAPKDEKATPEQNAAAKALADQTGDKSESKAA